MKKQRYICANCGFVDEIADPEVFKKCRVCKSTALDVFVPGFNVQNLAWTLVKKYFIDIYK